MENIDNNAKNFIEQVIKNNDVVLFMKGNKNFPQCGFSSVVSSILNNLNINFIDIDVLQSPELRDSIKTYSDWPTIPQLYLKGEFMGGCDIVKELYSSGDLFSTLDQKGIAYSKPSNG